MRLAAKKKEQLKAERYKEIAQPEEEDVKNIVGYYIVSFLLLPVGWIIGWVWGYSKKQLPDGYKVYAYNEKVRNHGRIIFWISIVLFVLGMMLKIVGTR